MAAKGESISDADAPMPDDGGDVADAYVVAAPEGLS